MAVTIDMQKVLHAQTYDLFLKESERKLRETDVSDLEGNQKMYHDYRKLNMARTRRLEKTFVPDEDTKELFTRLNDEQIWVVITEDWCGDSAQNLPVISKLATLSNKITLKVLNRDENLDIMDLFLTNGKRSIPKLAALDKDGNLLFEWGPRPASAKALVKDKVEIGVPKEEWAKALHTWYAKNKGKETESEFKELMKPFCG
jgi:hypothetical protein